MADKKSRGWLTVCYPTSEFVHDNFPDCKYDGSQGWGHTLPVHFSDLSRCGCQFLVSPLHCDDVNADGTVKKPHWHLLLLWDGPTTYSNAKYYVSLIHGTEVQPMVSLRGAARYLCHLDNPEKVKYNKADVLSFGGLDYEEIINSASDSLLVLYEVFDWIDETQCVSFRQLIMYCRRQKTDWAKVILTQYRENVIAYQRSLKWEIDQNIIANQKALAKDD